MGLNLGLSRITFFLEKSIFGHEGEGAEKP